MNCVQFALILWTSLHIANTEKPQYIEDDQTAIILDCPPGYYQFQHLCSSMISSSECSTHCIKCAYNSCIQCDNDHILIENSCTQLKRILASCSSGYFLKDDKCSGKIIKRMLKYMQGMPWRTRKLHIM